MGKTNFLFRSWYYFRNGWSVYFAFIFAAVNTLTVTYYLAIEKYTIVNNIFPTFVHYIAIVVSIGIPILIIIGYIHYKKTSAYRAETEITYETNPFARRMVVNTEILLSLNLQLINIITTLSNKKDLSIEEEKEIKKLQSELVDFVKNRTFENNDDLLFLKKMRKN